MKDQPEGQQQTAEAVANLLSIMDSPRRWTAQPWNTENWRGETTITSTDNLSIDLYEDYRKRDRWIVTAELGMLSKYLERYCNPRKDENAPQISIAKKREASAIAADIYRRIIPDYRQLRATLLHRRRDEQDKAETAHQTALDFVAASGGLLEILHSNDQYTGGDDIKVYMNRSNGVYIRARINTYGGNHIDAIDLPNDLLSEVIRTIAAYVKRNEAKPC
jgi:hypothetical protein